MLSCVVIFLDCLNKSPRNLYPALSTSPEIHFTNKIYFDKIQKLIENLDVDTKLSLEAISEHKTFIKGEYLLKAGSVCNYSYLVKSGIVRKFYVHQDREVTTEFFFNDHLAISFDSYVLQKPSREYIQAVTDTVENMTDYNAFQNPKVLFPKLQELDFQMTEYYALGLEEMVFELHTQNATQRYHTLLTKSPHIVQQVQLTQIASYLNISLETLSRIRAKI